MIWPTWFSDAERRAARQRRSELAAAALEIERTITIGTPQPDEDKQIREEEDKSLFKHELDELEKERRQRKKVN